MIDYQEIKSKYPKAWEKLESFKKAGKYSQGYMDIDIDYFQPRDLFDFFDQQGIMGYVQPILDRRFVALFDNEGRFGMGWAGDYRPDRKQAEEDYYTKAFELLEEKL